MTIQKVINNGFGAYKSSETAVKPAWGVERVSFNGLIEFSSATGASEFKLSNNDPRFRFINGSSHWITGSDQFGGNDNVTTNNALSVFLNSSDGGAGGELSTAIQGQLEIDFFGTDINLLIADGLIGGNDNMDVIPYTTPVGSSTETTHATINLPTGSAAGTGPNSTIASNNRKANQVLPLNLGLTEGGYKLRLEFIIKDAFANLIPNGQLPLFGCEIINARTVLTGNTTISDGQMFDDGYRYELSSETGLPLIPSSYGNKTRGARVINYINSLSKVYEQAVQDVDAAQANLAAATHTNEEVIRKVNWRDFGAGNNFATYDAAGAAQLGYVLPDGTTSLNGFAISIQEEQGRRYPSVGASGGSSYAALTFVGTGLDIIATKSRRSVATANFPYELFVDGTSIGLIPSGVSNEAEGYVDKLIPLVSGLPYGTHVVSIQLQSGAGDFTHWGPTDFIIYGPKKPDSIPAGAVEIADYNIVAEYAIKSNTAMTGNVPEIPFVSQGILGKSPFREVRYNGGWSGIASSNRGNPKIFDTFTSTANAFMEYTFYGTGFELMARTNTSNFITTVSIDGALYTGAATPIFGNGGTISTWTPSTSRWTQVSAGFREGLSISGLTLGLHTIRLTLISGGPLALQDLAVITPIHYNDPDLRNGSLSIGDVRPDTPDVSPAMDNSGNLGEAKAWIRFNKDGGQLQASYNISAAVEDGNTVYCFFDKPFKDAFYVGLATVNTTSSTPISVQTDSPGEARVVYAENGPFHAAFFGELIDE